MGFCEFELAKHFDFVFTDYILCSKKIETISKYLWVIDNLKYF